MTLERAARQAPCVGVSMFFRAPNGATLLLEVTTDKHSILAFTCLSSIRSLWCLYGSGQRKGIGRDRKV